MKKLIEARDAKVAELDSLVVELDEMDAGEAFDSKFARSKANICILPETSQYGESVFLRIDAEL